MRLEKILALAVFTFGLIGCGCHNCNCHRNCHGPHSSHNHHVHHDVVDRVQVTEQIVQ